jgi:hypothetical protein
MRLVMQRRNHHREGMHTLKIEHAIRDFETWKLAFDRDPVGREQSGVRGYRVYRPQDDRQYVLIDLDFDHAAAAAAFLEKLRQVWGRVELSPGLARGEGAAAVPPRTRIVERVATG